ncbi:hypothetical protein GCM10011488_01110 [Steroidobacter agaridevorans]|nr:hypothetical protein GCM10011488_01110 [Steroidobacter agaridevorans]
MAAQACEPGQDTLKARLIQGTETLGSLAQLAFSLVLRAENLERELIQLRGNGIAAASEQLRKAEHQLDEARNFVFVCLQAMRPGGEVDATCEILTVLDAAYVKLTEDVSPHIRDAQKALNSDTSSRSRQQRRGDT